MPFNNLTLADAQAKNGELATDDLKANRLFVQGDHWQDSAGWVGPLLSTGSQADADFLLRLKRVFVSQNVMAEGVGRHIGGVIGHEPAWDMVLRDEATPEQTDREASPDEPPEPEIAPELQALMDEADAALTAWWDKRGLLDVLKDAIEKLLYDANSKGQSHIVLRLYIPRSLTEAGEIEGLIEIPRQATLQDALDLLWLEVPEPEQASVTLDPDTKEEMGVYVYEREGRTYAEITYLIDDLTILQILDGEGGAPLPYPLAGRLFHHQLNRSALLTPQVRQLQMLLNKSWTVLSRNLDTAGFVSRFFLDANPPGQWTVNDAGKDVFTPSPIQMGPGTVNFIGPSMVEEQGIKRWGNPTIHVDQPVDVTTFTNSIAASRQALMAELDQLHTLITGDATASGKSRVQALADYMLSLLETKSALEAAIRWLLETSLALAAIFMDQAGRYEALRAQAECRLDLGPIDPETMNAVMALVNAKLLSRETGMTRIGVEDPDAEMDRIASEGDKLMSPPERVQLERTQFSLEQDRAGADRLANIRTAIETPNGQVVEEPA